MSSGRAPSLAVALALALAASPAAVLAVADDAAGSVYTSIRRGDCGDPPPAVRDEFAGRDLGVQECPAPDGWRLLYVSSDTSSWLELRRGEVAWSAEEAVVYGQAFGQFPNVAGSPVVEWRRDASGLSGALIFRVVARNPDDPDRRLSRLFVVRLALDGPCVLGQVATNGEARRLADGPATCPGDAARRGG